MKALVTGGAGYIGSHLVRMLCEAGHEVVVLDDLSSGRRQAVHHAAAFVEGCMGDVARVRGVLSMHKPDLVFHFAGLIRVDESVQDPAKYFRVNVGASLRLLDAMLAEGVRRIVFSSTAAVYGNPTHVPISEEHVLAPINPYGESKAMLERVLQNYHDHAGLSFAALRYFNAAGAHPSGELGEHHDPETHLIPRLLDAAREPGAEATVFGADYATSDGTCVRDYIHVMDLARAHVLAAEQLLHGARRLVLNLGTGVGSTVLQVLDEVEHATHTQFQRALKERRAGDPAILVADAARAREVLGWTPQHSLHEIVVDAARARERQRS